MSLQSILSKTVHTIGPDETAHAAAQRMKRLGIGCLVVVDAKREPVGILTDRDLVTRTIAEDRDPRDVAVASVMSPDPTRARDDVTIGDAIALMRLGGFRRLPVVSPSGTLAGMVTLDDVLELLARELSDVGLLIEAFTTPRRPTSDS